MKTNYINTLFYLETFSFMNLFKYVFVENIWEIRDDKRIFNFTEEIEA